MFATIFGLDNTTINGLHREPYMFFAGIVGVLSTVMISAVQPSAVAPTVCALLLLLININFAIPDVMIDATVAERSKQRPELAAELQALCWGAINAAGAPVTPEKP